MGILFYYTLCFFMLWYVLGQFDAQGGRKLNKIIIDRFVETPFYTTNKHNNVELTKTFKQISSFQDIFDWMQFNLLTNLDMECYNSYDKNCVNNTIINKAPF